MKPQFSRRQKILLLSLLALLLILAGAIYLATRRAPAEESDSPDKQEQQSTGQQQPDTGSQTPDPGDTDGDTPVSSDGDTPVSNDGGSGNSGSSGSSGSSGGSTGSGSSSSSGGSGQPAHQHVWKEHTAQRWISNMVTVPDYAEQKVAVGTKYIFAYDGYTTASDADAENHAIELILAGQPDNYRMETIYETQTVQVGSHQEDQGHYETYVDYRYCDCGARQ